jgi:hypothetical protein
MHRMILMKIVPVLHGSAKAPFFQHDNPHAMYAATGGVEDEQM